MTRKTILATVMVFTVIAASITASSIAYAAQDPKPKDIAKSFFDIFTEKGYTPNSFFDVFTELQTDASKANSFFDVFTERGYAPNSFFDVFTELQQNDANHQTQLDSLKSRLDKLPVDSFFDITYRIDIPGITQGSTEINGYSHQIVSPRDAATGQASGKRQHAPFVIVKEVDKSTPLLYHALVTNENIPSVELTLSRPNPSGDGTTQEYFKIHLTNAHVSSIVNPTNHIDTSGMEEVSFVYQQIEWESADGGTSQTDNWEPPEV